MINGAMIALLPDQADWTDLELPHLTLVYAGPKDDLKPTDFNELAKDACMLSLLTIESIALRVVSKQQYGRGSELVEAFKLQPTHKLWAMRRTVEKWNKSEYPFDPHVTIGPLGTDVQDAPSYIRFTKILAAWGDQRLVFGLQR